VPGPCDRPTPAITAAPPYDRRLHDQTGVNCGRARLARSTAEGGKRAATERLHPVPGYAPTSAALPVDKYTCARSATPPGQCERLPPAFQCLLPTPVPLACSRAPLPIAQTTSLVVDRKGRGRRVRPTGDTRRNAAGEDLVFRLLQQAAQARRCGWS